MNKESFSNPAEQVFFSAGLLFVILFVVFVPASGQTFDPFPANSGTSIGLVLVVPIKGDIDSGLSFFLQRMIRRAEREQAKAVILEISSNGGLVTSGQEMKDALIRANVPTIAFIRGRALSAAALVAISCHKIFMEPGSEMGAATPFSMLGPAVDVAPEKFISAFKGEFESAAELRKRPKNLAAAMVDKNHDEIPGLVKRGEILTLTTESAQNHGYCDGIVTSIDTILKRLKIDAVPLEIIAPTSMELLARWLTSPNISTFILTIGVWSLILEFLVFGWGLLGWFGLMCISLFFGGHLFAYLAGLEAILLFVVGGVLLALEIFVIPGFGITGIMGILCLATSIVFVYGDVYIAVEAVSKITAMSIVMIVVLYNLAPRMKLFDRFVLKEKMSTDQGFVAIEPNAYDKLLHLEGISLSPCRPAGFVRIGTEKYEVTSDGEFIERSRKIVVVAVEGTKIVVRALNS